MIQCIAKYCNANFECCNTLKYNIIRVMHVGVEKKTYSFRFDETMIEKLRGYAAEENRNLSNMIETILLQYLSKREREEQKNDL